MRREAASYAPLAGSECCVGWLGAALLSQARNASHSSLRAGGGASAWSARKMRREAAWIHDLEISLGKTIPLHVTRYFPAYRMEAEALPVRTIRQLAAAAREQLSAVYLGNC